MDWPAFFFGRWATNAYRKRSMESSIENFERLDLRSKVRLVGELVGAGVIEPAEARRIFGTED